MSVCRGIKKLTKSNKGFTLIEVLIGVFIAAVGIVGVLEIQKHVIRSGNEVNARTIAIQLVRDKLDTINNIDAFADVGVIPPPAVENNIEKSNYTFTRTWQMTTHHFDEDASTWGAVGVDESTDAKHVTVSVSWTDINNELQTVTGDQVIASASIHDTSGLSNAAGERTVPNIPFNQLSSIENPAITLVDELSPSYLDYYTKETSKPVPTVDARHGNNLIQFETVTYDTESDKQTLEDFVTVNCSCSFNGSGNAKAPTILTLSDDDESLTNDKSSGDTINKAIGAVSGSDQPELCTACCEDHHDSGDESTPKYVAGTSGGDHPHYNASLARSTSDYVEACRFRRVDGFYEMVPDWQLADIIIMPKSYFFETTNVSAYVSYVKSVVRAKLRGDPLPAKPDVGTRNMTDLVAGEHQLIARGIYVDIASLSSVALAAAKSYESGANFRPNWLEYVPFYEINLSLFADWESSDTTIGSITNETISTIIDPATNYYGTYSRGWLTAISNGTTTITAAARTDNTGITGSGAIIPPIDSVADDPETDIDETVVGTSLIDTINATVNTAGSGDVCTDGCKSIAIAVSCIKYRNNGTQTTCTGQDGQSVNLNYSAGLTCTTGDTVTFPIYSYPNVTCNGVSSTWIGGWISLSYPGFKFYYPAPENSTPEEIAAAEASAQTELVVYIGDVSSFSAKVNMLKQ